MVALTYCLIDQAWLPVRRRSGRREWIAPHQITTEIDGDPIVRPDWGRADFDAATLQLFSKLGFHRPERLSRVAVLATLLAHVRENDSGRSVAQALGRKSIGDEDGAVLKKLRFQRLIEAEGDEEIQRGFRRAISLAGGTLNVRDFIWLVLTFDKEETRRRFTFDYYGAGIAASSSNSQVD